MKRIYVLCEGHTEVNFVSYVLQSELPHFIFQPVLFETSKGFKKKDIPFSKIIPHIVFSFFI